MSHRANMHGLNSYGSIDGSYSHLGSYTTGCNKCIKYPLPASTVSGYYVVPNYSTPGFSSLTHGVDDNPTEYFQIGKAYGVGSNKCVTTYSASLCN